jgi:hypothetical protein
MAGALVAASPVIAACAVGPTFDEWAATDGAAGRINLDDVQSAFKRAKSASDFEREVNQIFEGDGLVLIRVRDDDNSKVLEGWEDLNSNTRIDDTSDDLLFSIAQKDDGNELRGHGSNSYYNRGFGGGDFLFTYLVISSMSSRGGYYYPPPNRQMSQQRSTYRTSSRYRSQVTKNSSYFSRSGGYSRSQYNDAGRTQSTARQRYQSSARTTGSYARSGTGVRSSWGSSSRGGSFGRSSGGRGGGFRGFGGGLRIIGGTRG